MSRSGYSEDLDNWDLIRWRGRVASATRGKRGQQFFRDLLEALDAMPEKRLIREELQTENGVCAIGSLGVRRGIDMSNLDPEEPEQVGEAFGIAACLAQEVVYMNDEAERLVKGADGKWRRETPDELWTRMREWVQEQIRIARTPEPRKGERR